MLECGKQPEAPVRVIPGWPRLYAHSRGLSLSNYWIVSVIWVVFCIPPKAAPVTVTV